MVKRNYISRLNQLVVAFNFHR